MPQRYPVVIIRKRIAANNLGKNITLKLVVYNATSIVDAFLPRERKLALAASNFFITPLPILNLPEISLRCVIKVKTEAKVHNSGRLRSSLLKCIQIAPRFHHDHARVTLRYRRTLSALWYHQIGMRILDHRYDPSFAPDLEIGFRDAVSTRYMRARAPVRAGAREQKGYAPE